MSHNTAENSRRGCPDCGETNGHAIGCSQQIVPNFTDACTCDIDTYCAIHGGPRLAKFDPENYPEDREVEQQKWTGEQLAERFHEIYERRAPEFGYETRKETREFDPTTPNGKLMIATCTEIAAYVNVLIDALQYISTGHIKDAPTWEARAAKNALFRIGIDLNE